MRLKECLDEKNHTNKKKEHPKLCWAAKVKFEFGGRFGGQKGTTNTTNNNNNFDSSMVWASPQTKKTRQCDLGGVLPPCQKVGAQNVGKILQLARGNAFCTCTCAVAQRGAWRIRVHGVTCLSSFVLIPRSHDEAY